MKNEVYAVYKNRDGFQSSPKVPYTHIGESVEIPKPWIEVNIPQPVKISPAATNSTGGIPYSNMDHKKYILKKIVTTYEYEEVL